jgi:predicted dehydrogenase
MPSAPLRVLVAGCGNMGSSHARAYHAMPEFDVIGVVSRRPATREALSRELGGVPAFDDYFTALTATTPDVVSINTYPDTHAPFAMAAIEAGCHVFCEKPIATTLADAEVVVHAAGARAVKMVVGYILRVHPAWMRFTEIARTLGKPLVMRMNLNQQSSGPSWTWHKNLMDSLSPLVDCGVHYVDVMCQMTGAKPVRVHGMGAHLSDEVKVYNYGALQVVFDDGSVGWYEAGWGPMMSEIAFFVKDVVGPKGCVSIVVPQDGQTEAKLDAISTSADIDSHVKTNALKIHFADIDKDNNFTKRDEWLRMDDEPGHQELCNREQAYFLKAIREDLDLTDSMNDAVNSLKIVLAADRSIHEKRAVEL